jgi:molybdopterin-guanine dinucleotide biosynthesis protein A
MPDGTLTYETLLDTMKQLGTRSDQVVVVFDANDSGKMHCFELNTALDLIQFFGISPIDGVYYVLDRKDIHLLRPGRSI